jgi:hypothetical protein
MAVITINVIVSNLETVQRSFNQIKVYRSITGLEGVYTEVTGTGTRLALETGKSVYAFTDSTGEPHYYYKSSYFHSVSLLESSLSAAQQGEGDFALSIVSVQELKTNYLYGLDLTDDSGNGMPDSLYEWFIKSAVSWFEHRLQLSLRPKPITSELHDYYQEDCREYVFLKAKEYPIIDVTELRIVIPGTGGSTVQTFGRESLQIEREAGHIHVVPGVAGSGVVVMGTTGAWLPYPYGARRFIPGIFQLDYTAGFATEDLPMVLRDAIGKLAAFGPLNPLGDLLGGAGIASQNLSIDGLSQGYTTTSSAMYAGYGARLAQYEKEIKQVIPTLEKYYKGLRMVVA